MSFLRDKVFSAVALSHFIVDLLNSQRALLLTFLSGPLKLSNTFIGLISTIYVSIGGLSQPLFGYITDRFGPKWIVTIGVLWLGSFFTLAIVTPGKIAFWFLVIAALGSGMFHPAGTMQATMIGRKQYQGRETTTASYFFVFGQLGLFFGPMIGGPLLDRFGPLGLLIAASLCLPIALNSFLNLNFDWNYQENKVERDDDLLNYKINSSISTLIAFGTLAAFQSWAQQNMITFLPKYLKDLGKSASLYGFMSALFMGGSALGNALGGPLADKYGKRIVAGTSLILGVIPLYIISIIGWSPWLFLIIPLAGLLTGSTHSIIVVSAQNKIPGQVAFVSGLILGFMFASGSLGTLLAGYLADIWGFPTLFLITAGIVLIGSLLTFSLKEDKTINLPENHHN